jgi:subtilisin
MHLWMSKRLWVLLCAMLVVSACRLDPSITLSVNEAAPGDEITTRLTNLSGIGAQVLVAGNPATIGSVQSASELSFIVPLTTPAGQQLVQVISSNRVASSTLLITESPNVTPTVILDREWVVIGDTVTLTATDVPVQDLTVEVAGQEVTLSIIDENRVSFAVPELPAGRQPVIIRSGQLIFDTLLRLIDPSVKEETRMTLLLQAGVDEITLREDLKRLGFEVTRLSQLSQNPSLDACSGVLAEIDVGGLSLTEALEQLKELEQTTQDAILHIDPRSNWSIGTIDYLSATGAPVAQGNGLTGAGNLIAVLDTGVSPHPELGARLRNDLGFVAIEGSVSFADDFDDINLPNPPASPTPEQDGHGTPVAVLAAGETLGVAPGAEVMPVKVCDAFGVCLSSDVIIGMCHALDVAADPGNDIGLNNLIVNLSLGGNMPVEALEAIIAFALDNDVSVVAAGGNQGELNNPLLKEYPAAFDLPGLLAVAALSADELVCADFEDLPRDTVVNLGNSLSTAGYSFPLTPFFFVEGQSATEGSVSVADGRPAGGSGQGLFVSNVNLGLEFGQSLAGLTLNYTDFGGNNNLTINGERLIVDDLNALDGRTLAGVKITVTLDDPSSINGSGAYSLSLTGKISSLAIGGQELLIDDVCPQVGAAADWSPAGFSTQGDYLDIAAPGQGLLVSIPSGEMVRYEGTSFATPLVAGAVALWKEAYPDLTPLEVADNLRATARPLFDGAALYPPSQVGAGMLDLSSKP